MQVRLQAMIAARLRPFYEAQAKERQGTRNDLKQHIEEKIPQARKLQSRDEAGKAADF
jgi:hypothetical protein